MNEMSSGPIRMCLGCNARLPKSALIRYVWCNGTAVADLKERLPGRGAYHCRNEQCKQRFHTNRKRLGQAFRLA